MSDAGQVEQLIKEAVEAIKKGDKQVGRGKLEAAVQIDSYNEQAWLLLAQIANTPEDRRIALGNVIIINPSNARAQKMLEQLESAGDSGRSSGISAKKKRRGGYRLILGGLVLLGLLLVSIAGLLILGGGDEEAPIVPTVSSALTPSATVNEVAQATLLASITPSSTPLPTATPFRSGATWTPSPAPSDTPTPQQFPPPPSELTGRIILQSGRVTGDDFNQPIAVIAANNPESYRVVSPEGARGQLPALVRGENRYAWVQYQSGTRSYTIQIQRFNATDTTNIVFLYDNRPTVIEPSEPTWFGNNLVFTAQALGEFGYDLWLLPVDETLLVATPVPAFGSTPTPSHTPTATLTPTPAPTLDPAAPTLDPALVTPTLDPAFITPTEVPSILRRLTADGGENRWAAFDPTGTALVYVSTVDKITDLRVVNINSQAIFVLTNNANTLIESAPDWSPSNEIVFSASTEAKPQLSDLYLMPASGESEPTLLLDFGPRDIQPRFSPDGRYIVFSSDYYGNWDVFIYDRTRESVYALYVKDNSTDIANDWTD